MGFTDYANGIRDIEAFNLLAGAVVERIEEQPFTYVPRKQRGRRRVEALGWRDRLQKYEWRPNDDSNGAVEARTLAIEFEPLARKIDVGAPLSMEEGDTLQSLANRTFTWGGVKTGTSKAIPSVSDITSVVKSALRWQHVDAAFMDAGWTKVAGLSTEWLEGTERIPQIIYDSRVSAGLIRNVEHVYVSRSLPACDAILPHLQDRLRRLPSRDAARFGNLKLAWKMRYEKKPWEPQFFGTFLVKLMRDVLNENPDQFGRMPTPEGDKPWTMRGVEMVLFMEGY